MENYVVSARKYRPGDFHSVVGQEHITSTLQNALRNNQLAQAFLFCGPRGVGKTTCARILAKTINCTNLTEQTEACNECDSCKAFNSNASFNIVELDAASNNSVEDIRALIEQVKIPPQNGKYKVYIIDEVHMLSTAAFNAFLKTLEEPPAYAKFILATTEKHKIMPTILSRCQIFDFHRISNDDIAKHLEYIATKEGVAFEKEALHIIAQKADGGLRDALSMFDQLVSFTGANLTYNNIIDNLNVLDYDYYFKLTDMLLAGDIPSCLLLFDQVLKKGFEGSHFMAGLAGHFRNLLVCKNQSSVSLLQVSSSVAQRYVAQAQTTSQDFVLKALGCANSCALEYKDSYNKRLCVELALMRMAYLSGGVKPSSQPVRQTIVQQQSPAVQSVPLAEAKKKNDEPYTLKASSEKVKASLGMISPYSINKAVPLSDELREKNIEIEKKKQSSNFEAIKQSVLRFAESIKETNPNLAFSLQSADCTRGYDNCIIFEVNNSLSEQDIERNKQKIMAFVRQETGSDDFFIQVKCHLEKVETKVYTTADTYSYFVKKQKGVEKLKQVFDCDFEY